MKTKITKNSSKEVTLVVSNNSDNWDIEQIIELIKICVQFGGVLKEYEHNDDERLIKMTINAIEYELLLECLSEDYDYFELSYGQGTMLTLI